MTDAAWPTRQGGLYGASGATTRRRSRTEIDWRQLDWTLLGACIAIIVLGLVMVYSSSRNLVDDDFYFLKRQGFALVLGLGAFWAALAIDYRKFRDFSLTAYIAVVVLLFFVLTPIGSSARGAQAWYTLPFHFQIQPSELAKFGLIVALAGYVNEHRGMLDPWRMTLIIGLAAVPLGLIQLQPDFGTNMVLVFIVIGLLTVAGIKGRYILAFLLLGATGIFALVNLGIFEQYQLDRFSVVFDSGSGKQEGSGYNQDQSKKAIGSGGITGKGLFQGSQTELGFVPEQQTDFIFSAVGEELGFLGGATLLVLFALVLWRTWRIARLSRDYYGTLVCGGVFSMFAFMIFENIGMTMGIMPVAGIPLPFMSYGGSALIACCACIGLVANVHLRRFS